MKKKTLFKYQFFSQKKKKNEVKEIEFIKFGFAQWLSNNKLTVLLRAKRGKISAIQKTKSKEPEEKSFSDLVVNEISLKNHLNEAGGYFRLSLIFFFSQSDRKLKKISFKMRIKNFQI